MSFGAKFGEMGGILQVTKPQEQVTRLYFLKQHGGYVAPSLALLSTKERPW
jgi:hypothetical protein